jgi:hypothetical protein
MTVVTLNLPQRTRWGTKDDVLAVLRSRWESGIDLTESVRGAAWVPLVVPLRPPTAAEYSADYDRVRAWVERWRTVPTGLRLEWDKIGGRRSGVTEVPVRAVVDDRQALWRFLKVANDVHAFEDITAQVTARLPDALDWVAGHPHHALAKAEHWSALIEVILWIRDRMPASAWVRQVDVPTVDTKFIERHRETLVPLLDACLPAERVDLAHPGSAFGRRYGFANKPAYARVRRPDGSALYPQLPGVSEMALRVDEIARLPLPGRVFVVENEVTYHAFPPLPEAVVFLGAGYGVSRLLRLDWLEDAEVIYWGDIDTHGFVMLDRLRARFSQIRSVLMDRSTLLGHEAHWGREDEPVNVTLGHLTAEESALYVDLVEDRYGVGVRLEQERIRFGRIAKALRNDAGPAFGGP